MRKFYLTLTILLSIFHFTQGQTSLRGMYIDNFDQIFGNQNKEDSLLHYAQDSSYNYLALYSLHHLNLNNSSTADHLAAFIYKARVMYGITYVGAVCESYSSFETKISPFNMSRSDDNERFNVFNLEFEFWIQSSVGPGGYYCTQYLQSANCNCDTSGAFKYYISELHKIDSLAATQNVMSETYVGWFNQGQGQQIHNNADRILLHAYRTGTSTLYSYSETRLQYLASTNTTVNVVPIFSAEPVFMGPWLEDHTQLEAYNQYKNDFDSDNSSWKQYVNILGYQWFDYGFLPKQIPIAPSAIIKLEENNSVLNTYPNPANDILFVELNSISPATTEFILTNNYGQIIRSEKINILKGKNNILINTSEYAAGIYFLSVQDRRNVFSKKVVVAH